VNKIQNIRQPLFADMKTWRAAREKPNDSSEGPIKAHSPASTLVSVSDGFYMRMSKRRDGTASIVCQNCDLTCRSQFQALGPKAS
jgi:hypothetical protein